MKIPLHKITEHALSLSFTEKDPWVFNTLLEADEAKEPPLQERSVQLRWQLRLVDTMIVVSGQCSTSLHLVCSRCANPFLLPCHTQFTTLFSKDPQMIQGNHQRHHTESTSAPLSNSWSESQDPHLEMIELDQDFIDLSTLLFEQFQLQVPLKPLCQDSCQGLCLNCGTDLNDRRCGCLTSSMLQKGDFYGCT